MNNIQVQPWGIAYLAFAVLFACAASIVGRHLRAGEPPSGAARGALAVIAGMLWPLLVVGLAQLWVVHQVATRLRTRTGLTETARLMDLVAVR